MGTVWLWGKVTLTIIVVFLRGASTFLCEEPSSSAVSVRQCGELLSAQSKKLLTYFDKVEMVNGQLPVDESLPSLYTFKAIALFEERRLPEAIAALKMAVKRNPADLSAWSNLAELQTMAGNITDGNSAYDMVESLSGVANIGLRYRRIRWKELELHIARERRLFLLCLERRRLPECDKSRFTSSIEFAELNGSAKMELDKYFVRDFTVPDGSNAATQTRKHTRRLTIGYIMAIVDGGPVNALMQSFLRHADRRRVELVAFILSTDVSLKDTWLEESLSLFDEVVGLHGMSDAHSAYVVAQRGVDILFDINGYSYLTGIHVLKYRPSPIQVNFLGDPTSTALSFFDYYLGDRRANPPDVMTNHFSEKMAMLPGCYLANSHMEWTPDLLLRPRALKSELPLLTHSGVSAPLVPVACPWCTTRQGSNNGNNRGTQAFPLLLGVFHTYNKFDPTVFAVWMNIMRRSPSTALVFNYNPADPEAMLNLIRLGQAHGATESRMRFLTPTKWYAHTHFKTGLDLYLDTYRKTGHTTTVDAAWAGLPTVALGAQDTAPRRSSESILHASAENTHGLVYSMKEYEDLVVALTSSRRGRERLDAWRQHTEQARAFGDLFSSLKYAQGFVRIMQAMSEAARLKDSSAWSDVRSFTTEQSPPFHIT
jgi:protein O-GlcNAc transferase